MHLKSSEDCLPVAKYILQNAVHECYYLIFRSFPGRSSNILTAISDERVNEDKNTLKIP